MKAWIKETGNLFREGNHQHFFVKRLCFSIYYAWNWLDVDCSLHYLMNLLWSKNCDSFTTGFIRNSSIRFLLLFRFENCVSGKPYRTTANLRKYFWHSTRDIGSSYYCTTLNKTFVVLPRVLVSLYPQNFVKKLKEKKTQTNFSFLISPIPISLLKARKALKAPDDWRRYQI